YGQVIDRFAMSYVKSWTAKGHFLANVSRLQWYQRKAELLASVMPRFQVTLHYVITQEGIVCPMIHASSNYSIMFPISFQVAMQALPLTTATVMHPCTNSTWATTDNL